MADVSIYLFMTADEFLDLLDFARNEEGDVLYAVEANRFDHASRSAPLPAELVHRVQTATHPLTLYLVAGGVDVGTHPNELPGRLVTAYFGGGSDAVLFGTESTARSTDGPTLALAKAVKSRLTKISKRGVSVFALPDGERKESKRWRYTEGAARALREGVAWRQSGAANVGYGLLGRG
jgi:hypothetical protein